MESKVNVRIYGQEYTIAGDRDAESIRKVASYVDEQMRQIARAFTSGSTGSVAVLAAVNMADELLECRAQMEARDAEKAQLEKDAEHYLKMWDEAKKSFAQYKESAARRTEEMKQADERYRDLEAKCSEFESSYFDLQMENIRLKQELEEYKKTDE